MGRAGVFVAVFVFVSCKASEPTPTPASGPEPPKPEAVAPAKPEVPVIDSSCEADGDCEVIATYCGGWNAVNRSSVADARLHYDEIGAIKNCQEGAAPKPDSYCEEAVCGPQVWNSSGRLDIGKTTILPVSAYPGASPRPPYPLVADVIGEALQALEVRLSKERPSILDRSSNYRAQLIGVRLGPEKRATMYGNFFCGKNFAATKWTQTLVSVDDGGECYFEFEYDFRDKRVTKLSINGDG